MNRSKSAAFVLLIGVFAVGGAAGYVVKSATERRGSEARVRTDRELRRTAYDDLMLTAEQRVKWDSIIDARGKAVREVFAVPQIKAESIRTEAREALVALLTPEQRERWEARRKAFQEQQNRSRQTDKNKK